MKRFLMSVALVATVSMLTACGGMSAKNIEKKEQQLYEDPMSLGEDDFERYPLSEAVEKYPVWFELGDGHPVRTSVIRSVVTFEKGKATHYPFSRSSDEKVTLDDLLERSDEEVIDIAQRQRQLVEKELIESSQPKHWAGETEIVVPVDELKFENSEYSGDYTIDVKLDGTGHHASNNKLYMEKGDLKVVREENELGSDLLSYYYLTNMSEEQRDAQNEKEMKKLKDALERVGTFESKELYPPVSDYVPNTLPWEWEEKVLEFTGGTANERLFDTAVIGIQLKDGKGSFVTRADHILHIIDLDDGETKSKKVTIEERM